MRIWPRSLEEALFRSRATETPFDLGGRVRSARPVVERATAVSTYREPQVSGVGSPADSILVSQSTHVTLTPADGYYAVQFESLDLASLTGALSWDVSAPTKVVFNQGGEFAATPVPKFVPSSASVTSVEVVLEMNDSLFISTYQIPTYGTTPIRQPVGYLFRAEAGDYAKLRVKTNGANCQIFTCALAIQLHPTAA